MTNAVRSLNIVKRQVLRGLFWNLNLRIQNRLMMILLLLQFAKKKWNRGWQKQWTFTSRAAKNRLYVKHGDKCVGEGHTMQRPPISLFDGKHCVQVPHWCNRELFGFCLRSVRLRYCWNLFSFSVHVFWFRNYSLYKYSGGMLFLNGLRNKTQYEARVSN